MESELVGAPAGILPVAGGLLAPKGSESALEKLKLDNLRNYGKVCPGEDTSRAVTDLATGSLEVLDEISTSAHFDLVYTDRDEARGRRPERGGRRGNGRNLDKLLIGEDKAIRLAHLRELIELTFRLHLGHERAHLGARHVVRPELVVDLCVGEPQRVGSRVKLTASTRPFRS